MDDLLEIAAALLPGVRLDRAVPTADGNIDHVLLIPGVAVVRVSKRPLAPAAMPGGWKCCAVWPISWPPLVRRFRFRSR